MPKPEELIRNKTELSEAKCNLENTLKDKAIIEEKLISLEKELKSERTAWANKASDFESDLLLERKKMERMKTNQEKQQKNRELELESLKQKIHSLENSASESTKLASKQQYDDLTAKYEILEEEHVVMKAQLVMEKETIASQLANCELELSKLRDLRDECLLERDTWHKERDELQEQIKEAMRKKTIDGKHSDMERTRLKSSLEDKCKEMEQFRRESDVLEDQFKNLRKENEDLKRKLDDFDKVSKVQRNISADSSALDRELAQLKNKLDYSEKSRKTDLVDCKMRYDNQISIVNEQLQSLQSQVTRFKRERDTFKHMLEGAQKALGELRNAASKSGRESRNSTNSNDEMEESKLRMATLEQQVSCMEDELSEARLESAKLKTELVSERSSWEVKISEMRSRVNELEEERLLSSGRTKVAGLRTRMELAWQKEREEQQRLLQETSTLARDLRQTLFEVERERDKERLEAKRKQEQLKKTAEEEQEENRKKLNELQCDLLELRDAHAKLRTTNEKLRREKERNEKEREELRANANSKRRGDQDDERRINILLAQVETLLRMVPESETTRNRATTPTTPTPPRRTRQGSKSRESSPGTGGGSSRASVEREIQYSVQRLKDAMQEVRQDRSRQKMSSMRRAASTEQDGGENGRGLNRRSLSLEHGSAGGLSGEQGSIWSRGQDDDSQSSMQSLDNTGSDSGRYYSMDSRLSGGSTQSEVITSGTDKKKKKKGIMGKLKKLTKARSIDDQSVSSGFYTQGGGSDTSVGTTGSEREGGGSEHRGSKRDLKDRLTGMFKRSGSSSRSNSVERKPTIAQTMRTTSQQDNSSSLQRPLGSDAGSTTTHVSRPSPTPSETSITMRRHILSSKYYK